MFFYALKICLPVRSSRSQKIYPDRLSIQ